MSAAPDETTTTRNYKTLIDLDSNSPLFRRLLHVTAIGVALYAVVLVVRGSETLRLLAPGIVFVLCIAALLIHRAGRTRTAFLIFVWGAWAAVALQAFLRAGVVNPGLYAYPVLMLLGGWILGVRQGMALGAASIVVTFCVAMVEEWQLWAPLPPASPIAYWIAVALVLSIGMLTMRHLLQNHWERVSTMNLLNARLQATIADLEAQHDALSRSEQRFAKISLASPLPIAISALADGCYLEVNPAWERTFGWSRQEALGKTSVALGFWASGAERAAWLADLKHDGRSLNRELRVRSANGSLIDTLLSAELIDYDGRAAVLAIFLDQTERKQIDAEVIRLNVELELRVEQRTAELSTALNTLQRTQEELVHSEKLAALGSLVAGVAHELNTPIGNAMMAASSLTDAARGMSATITGGTLRRSQLDEFVARCNRGADLVQRSLHRANELVRSFKQVAVDQASERRRKFLLGESVQEVIDTLRPSFKGLPWQIECEIDAGLALDSFPGALGQVVINLLMNSVVHAFDGRECGSVRVRGRVLDADTIELVCADDGTGIDPEALGRIFDPFFTTRLGRGGSGLGLSIVHRLVTQVLGGQIQVESTIGAGTVFRLVLPRMAPALSE
jgi:PAS domain S-box-containing protein